MTQSAAFHSVRIAILGVGSMGSAILAGVTKSSLPTHGIVATVQSVEAAQALREQYPQGLEAISIDQNPEGNADAVTGADVVIIAVKPAKVVDLLRSVSHRLQPSAVVISVAAGIPLASLQAAVPSSVEVVRAMPNTPALVGRGVTGLAFESRVSIPAREIAEAVLGTIGTIVEAPEKQIDALSAVSGSGPAYWYLFVEAFVAAAEELGFDHDTATRLVVETFAGSGELIRVTGKEATELRTQVTSPNGTTERAIAELEKLPLGEVVPAAFAAAIARAKELANG